MQANGLFVHRSPICIDGCFFQNPFLVDVRGIQYLQQFIIQSFAVMVYPLIRILLGNRQLRFQVGQLLEAILLHLLPFRGTHLIERGQCAANGLLKTVPDFFLVGFFMKHGIDFRETGQGNGIHPRFFHTQQRIYLSHGIGIGLRRAQIGLHLDVFSLRNGVVHKYIHLSSGNHLLNLAFNLVLAKGQHLGNAHRDIQKTVVNGTDFHRILRLFKAQIATSIAGHAANIHEYNPLSSFDRF